MKRFRRTACVLMMTLLAGSSVGCGAISADLARVRGYKAFVAGDNVAAAENFRKCVEYAPTDWKSHYYLGRIALDAQDDAFTARRHLETAESVRTAVPGGQLTPDPDPEKAIVAIPTRIQISDALAESMFRQGLRERLYHYLRETATRFGTPDDYLRLARYMAALGDRDNAETGFRKAALIANPGDPRPHIEMAAFYDTVGDRNAALVELRKAYYINPNIPGLADNIRAHGMVPGPTIRIPPEREKPEVIRPWAEDTHDPIYPAG